MAACDTIFEYVDWQTIAIYGFIALVLLFFVSNILLGKPIPLIASVVAAVASYFIFFVMIDFACSPRQAGGNTDFEFYRTMSYFAAAIAAVVTFITAVWRGSIADKQVQETIGQGIRTEEQLRLTKAQLQQTAQEFKLARSTNHADMLARASDLISLREADMQSVNPEVVAGVAMLQEVGQDENSSYAHAAVMLIVHFLSQRILDNDSPDYIRNAAYWLDDRSSKRPNFISAEGLKVMRDDFSPVFFDYLKRVEYIGGNYEHKKFYQDRVTKFRDANFNACEISGTIITGGETNFENCEIRKIPQPMDADTKIEIVGCNLSGCARMTYARDARFIVVRECHFESKNPPHPSILKQFEGGLTQADPIPKGHSINKNSS